MNLFEEFNLKKIFFNKKIRIISTVTSNITKENIIEMIKNGMNIIRIHMAYQKKIFLNDVVKIRNEIEKEYDIFIPILVDLKGIGIRVGEFKNKKTFLEKGKIFRFFNKKRLLGNNNHVSCDFGDFFIDINIGDKILWSHGKFTLKVIALETLEEGLEKINENKEIDKSINKKENKYSLNYTLNSIKNLETIQVIVCEILEDCVIKSHYPIFLSLKSHNNIISKKIKDIKEPICNEDIIFIDLAKELNIDYIAVSNVTDKNEIKFIKEKLLFDSKTKLLSKIQEKDGILNLDEILSYSEGIIICRNYLINYLNEISNYFLLKQIYEKCSKYKKLILVMGHIMESSLYCNIPNCNEINDLIGLAQNKIDGIILTRETMYSNHSIEVVNKITKIIYESEIMKNNLNLNLTFDFSNKKIENNNNEFFNINKMKNGLSKLVNLAIKTYNSPFILVLTQTGDTAFYLSKQDLSSSIWALCDNINVARFCCTLKGCYSFLIEKFEENFEKNIFNGINFLLKEKLINKNDYLIFIYGSIQGITNSTDSLKIINVNEIFEKHDLK